MHTKQCSCPLFSLLYEACKEQLKLNFSSFKLEAKDTALFLCLQLRAHREQAHQQPGDGGGAAMPACCALGIKKTAARMCQRTADKIGRPHKKYRNFEGAVVIFW